MTESTTPAASPDVVILLPDVPTSMGDVFGLIAPIMAQTLAPLPPMPQLVAPINGVPMDLGLQTTPVTDQALLADLANSPLQGELAEPVQAHRAHATITAAGGDSDVFASMELVSNVAASILDKSAATAVWLPGQLLVTTDVLYVGDVSRENIERTWFRVHALWADDARTQSLGFTRGLTRFGWPELQLHGATTDPSQLWREFTDSLGARLAQRQPAPREGDALTVGGFEYQLRPGTDLLGDPVLELAAAPPRKKSWFRRR